MPVFVNAHEITDDQIHAEMQYHPSDTLDEARLNAARALTIRRLLLDQAVERDMVSSSVVKNLGEDKTEELIERLLEEDIIIPDADAETCERYYEKHKTRFVDQKTEKPVSFSMVEAHIRQYLEDKAYHAAFGAYMDHLMDRAKIVGLSA